MIILSIPYRNIDSLYSSRSREYACIEYRLDYCENINALDFSQFNSQVILTYRDVSEGGKNPICDDDKLNLIQSIEANTDALIDCEYLFLKRNPAFRINPDRLILSLHTSYSDLPTIREFFSTDIEARFFKLAVSIDEPVQLDEILSLVPILIRGKLILIPTASCPPVFRLLYKVYGSVATYVYDQEKTSSNQPGLALATLCRIRQIVQQTEIFAIVGGEQILTSLSLFLYNFTFNKDHSDSVMLPIVAETAEEAIKIVDWLKCKCNIRGIVITMPFKQQIPFLVTGNKSIANSWIPHQKIFACTDEAAMNKALDKMKLSRYSSILIFGTGSISQMTQDILQKKGFDNYFVLSRNQMHLKKDQSDYNDTDLKKKYDLLINCTPYGLEETDKPELLPDFRALIDLSYGTEQTTLIRKAMKQNLTYVNGKTFWLWQAAEQASFFGLKSNPGQYLNN